MEFYNNEIKAYSVKASSHIITLLDDELIGSNSLALFELVENSYNFESWNNRSIYHKIVHIITGILRKR